MLLHSYIFVAGNVVIAMRLKKRPLHAEAAKGLGEADWR
jgi:hypothetical protein